MSLSRDLSCRTLAARVLFWMALALPLGAAGPVVLLIGPPGSGQNEQAELLLKERGMRMISADDLIAHNPGSFPPVKSSDDAGANLRLNPALNTLIEEAVRTSDLAPGLVLAGYPATKEQGDFLVGLRAKLGLPKAVVIHLNVPDTVVRKRLRSRPAGKLEQELKDYHRELDFARVYFPQADIHDVDATKSNAEVAKQIRQILEQR